MKNFDIKKILFFVFVLSLLVFAIPSMTEANNAGQKFTGSLETAAGNEGAGYSSNLRIGPAQQIGRIVRIALSLVGIILLLLMIYAGFIWMNARGNDAEVTKAKTILQNAIIGLVIVLMAYAITFFVTRSFVSGPYTPPSTENQNN